MNRCIRGHRFAPLVCALLAASVMSGCGARSALELLTVSATADASLSGDSGADASDASTISCKAETTTLVQASPVLMFVLDRSGSMGGQLGQTNGTESRWQILTDALASSLPPVDTTMEIGALFFPSTSGGFDCAVSMTADVVPALDNVPTLISLLEATTPGGATPTSAAIDAAEGLLLGVRAATQARALVLATDGAPNCNADLDPSSCTCAAGQGGGRGGCSDNSTMCLDATRTVATIASVAAAGVPTYVIGIDDSDDTQFVDVLNEMAVAGGRPNAGATRYYPGRSETDIHAALVAIRSQVGACTYLTASVPNETGTITVTVDGAMIAYDATGSQGWSWADRANGQIVLAGSACATAASAAEPVISATVTCGVADAAVDAEGGSQ